MAKTEIIDIQSHFLPEKWLAALSERAQYPFLKKHSGDLWVVHGSSYDKLPYYTSRSGIDIRSKLAEMDGAGIAISLLTLSPAGPDNAPSPEDADRLAQIANDGIAEIAAAYPERFRGVATLGYGAIERSADELRRCIDELRFVGLQAFPYIGGKTSIAGPELKPVWKVLSEKDVPLILHPGSPVNPDYGNYLIGGLMGYWFDDAIVMTKLILSGILDEFPGLKIVCPHTWSLLPYLLERLDHQVARFAKHFPDIRNQKPPSEYLRNVYTDCNNFSSDDLCYATKKMGGAGKMMFGSDSPFVPPAFILDMILNSGLPEADCKNIFASTAQRLFKIMH